MCQFDKFCSERILVLLSFVTEGIGNGSDLQFHTSSIRA